MLGHEFNLNTESNLDGLKIALVVDNIDSKALERVKVRVLGVHNMNNTNEDNSIYAQHIAPSKSSSGEIPDIGDYVYVMFMGNNPQNCYWIGWVRTIQG